MLPSEPQTAPLPDALKVGSEDEDLAPPSSRKHYQQHHHEGKSDGEKMNKEERQRAGFRRLTAYSVAEGFRLKLLLAYLKREHGIAPRVFDEAVYGVSALWRASVTPMLRLFYSSITSHYYLDMVQT